MINRVVKAAAEASAQRRARGVQTRAGLAAILGAEHAHLLPWTQANLGRPACVQLLVTPMPEACQSPLPTWQHHGSRGGWQDYRGNLGARRADAALLQPPRLRVAVRVAGCAPAQGPRS